jgi:superoxide dismutase
MAAMYQASRVGFDEDEATHVHSFKLIVPSLLGATKAGDKNDPKCPLPAVKDFTAWNPQDYEGGVKKHIQDGMDDISLAVTESIQVACASHPAASKLTTKMLYQTQVFVNELCSWTDSFYLELLKTSQVPAAEAWVLVASCIRKFWEVLWKFRAPANRAASKMDGPTRTTAYLWAMIQVHRELKLIRSHNFRGHPAVAPVITLHVFKTRITNAAIDKLTESL